MLARSDLQFDFPKYVPPTLPSWFMTFIKLLGTLLPILKFVFWAAVLAGVALLAWFIGRQLWSRYRLLSKREAVAPASFATWRPAPETARLLLHQADTLAAEGHFGEAVHLLLLRGIQDISERLPALLRPALTSREIGALEQLPAGPSAAFSRIARVVETSLFAKRPIGADDFARCRLEYEHFALPMAWSAERAQ
ncbi:MAG TPA: hypothetical protein VGI20_07210 [Rhizomicrobium sp.]